MTGDWKKLLGVYMGDFVAKLVDMEKAHDRRWQFTVKGGG